MCYSQVKVGKLAAPKSAGFRGGVYLFAAFLFLSAVFPAAAAQKPSWVDKQPANTAETVYFKGLADEATSASEAEKAAIRDLHARVAQYIMVGVRASDSEKTTAVQRGSGGAISDQFISEFYSEIETYTDLPLSRVEAQSYSEEYGPSKRKLWRAWALGAVSRQKLETESAEYPKRISGQYSRRIASGGNLAADIRNRQSILEDMDKKPLHKAVAQLKLPEGEVNLYDYLAAQVKEWAAGIVFDPIPAQKADKGETVTIPLKITSAHPLGMVEYRISLARANAPALVYSVPAIDTSALALGTYRGRVEMRLSALSPVLKDITREFSLEITSSRPVPPDKLFFPGIFGGSWNGTLSYSANGQSYRDRYTVNVYADGTCWIMVAARDGAMQAALGHWSEDGGRLRLSCEFNEPVITRLPELNWTVVYELTNSNRELRMNVKPAPDYAGVVKLIMNKER